MRLTLAFGGMTLGEMLRRISASELKLWSLYEQQNGLLDTTARGDIASAIVAKTVADVQRAKKQKPYPIDAFMAYPPTVAEDEDAEPEEDSDEPRGFEEDSDIPSEDTPNWADGWAPA